ncbi:MAG: hypothetical protein HY296_03280 [Thaumarchaeota archaeon]|nr:hypothetical protein [Nitrososphaerota archaeon]
MRGAVFTRHSSSSLVAFLLVCAALASIQHVPGRANATSALELSTSNGSTNCQAYLSGPGVNGTAWDATSSTCTVVPQANFGPTVCIASTSGGCSGFAIDELVIDAGVTVVMQSQGNANAAVLCVYSTLVNNGTLKGGSICDYGTIINYGVIVIPVGSYFMTLPYNGLGVFENREGGEVVNNYNFVDAGTVVNEGTIFNRGQFGNDNQYNGTFTNSGTFIGSAPCFSYDGCHTWVGIYNISSSGTTVDQTVGTGVSVTITGASGTNVAVISQNQTTAAPSGLGALNVSSAIFYDLMINGISTGTARVCISSPRVTQGMAGGMQYWNGTIWVFAADQAISQFTRTNTYPPNGTLSASISSVIVLCGDVPVSALTGTPLGAGTPSETPQPTTTFHSETTAPNSGRSSESSGPPTATSEGLSTTVPATAWTGNPAYLGVGVALVIAGLASMVILRRRR